MMSFGHVKLRERPPPGRSVEQIIRHFEVEQGIADRLKQANRPERARMYATMYDELFALVPDHPRLTRRRDPARLAALNAQKLALVERYLAGANTVVEFGCGDGSFAYSLCSRVGSVYGVDISDQRDPALPMPSNFEMVVYDGFDLPLPAGFADIAFSDQLIEHLHPDDVRLHFETVRRILRPGGVYILRTPHRYSGPHDVSRYVSNEARGFHLKEWTFRELRRALADSGFTRVRPLHHNPVRNRIQTRIVMHSAERVLCPFPQRLRTALARSIMNEITVCACVSDTRR
jgi:SAM-dependent methyltransferase